MPRSTCRRDLARGLHPAIATPLSGALVAAFCPGVSHALEWGGGNWGEEVWGPFTQLIPILPELGVFTLTLGLIGLPCWQLLKGRRPK